MNARILFSFLIVILFFWVLIPILNDDFSFIDDVYGFGKPPQNRPVGGHAVPEPSLLILLAGGIGGVLGYRYLKSRKKLSKDNNE